MNVKGLLLNAWKRKQLVMILFYIQAAKSKLEICGALQTFFLRARENVWSVQQLQCKTCQNLKTHVVAKQSCTQGKDYFAPKNIPERILQ